MQCLHRSLHSHQWALPRPQTGLQQGVFTDYSWHLNIIANRCSVTVNCAVGLFPLKMLLSDNHFFKKLKLKPKCAKCALMFTHWVQQQLGSTFKETQNFPWHDCHTLQKGKRTGWKNTINYAALLQGAVGRSNRNNNTAVVLHFKNHWANSPSMCNLSDESRDLDARRTSSRHAPPCTYRYVSVCWEIQAYSIHIYTLYTKLFFMNYRWFTASIHRETTTIMVYLSSIRLITSQ